MTTLRARSRKLLVGALMAAGMLMSSVIGFGADDASAMRCVHGDNQQTTHTCYNSEIGDPYPMGEVYW